MSLRVNLMILCYNFCFYSLYFANAHILIYIKIIQPCTIFITLFHVRYKLTPTKTQTIVVTIHPT